MANIGIAGFLHETNTFSAHKTTWAQFEEADAWPGVLVGHAIIKQTRHMNIAISGFVEGMRASEHTLVPLIWASAGPSGIVEQNAFEQYWQRLAQQLDQSPKLDALFLDLHGAMVAEHLLDCEGELLHRLRIKLGDQIPIVCALDFHANLSEAMRLLATLLIAYRYYPHTDIASTGERCAKQLLALLAQPANSWQCAHKGFEFLISLPWQATDLAPMKTLIAAIEELESKTHAIISFVPGFPLADVPFLQPQILTYARSQEQANDINKKLCDLIHQNKKGFDGKLYSITDAIHYINKHSVNSGRNGPIILADTQDNPGGGGDGDGTDILHALLDNRIHNACVGLLYDPEAAAVAHNTGVGAMIDIALGAKRNRSGKPPVTGQWQVLSLGSGEFQGTGAFYRGCQMHLGPMAALKKDGVTVVVSSRAQQAADQAMFKHLQLNPSSFSVLTLKSSVHFRADFAEHANSILIVAAPGSNIADLSTLKYEHYVLVT